MPSYTCLCCGYTQTFDTPELAFQAGWDVAPRFTIQPLCELCPTALIVKYGVEIARQHHAAAHARWLQEGRYK